MTLAVRPVTPARWTDFASLFESKGAPHFCWCTPYRFARSHEMTKAERRDAMRARIRGRGPVGVLAYEGRQPVGWCSVAPRASYEKLAGSRTMPTIEEDAWTVLCFFVPRALRGEGISLALLEGAVDYAREKGARVVEGYPWDTAGVSSTHRGRSTLFAAAGFAPAEGRRWTRRV